MQCKGVEKDKRGKYPKIKKNITEYKKIKEVKTKRERKKYDKLHRITELSTYRDSTSDRHWWIW